MSFTYAFVLLFLAPLYLLYKRDEKFVNKYAKREKKLLYLALAFSILALSEPLLNKAPNKQTFDAQDFIIALDASYSMQADDLKPTRYELAKKKLKQLLQTLPKNRFTVFAFTSNAILISPPTTDTAISLMALDALEPNYILTKGTSLSNLLKTVAKTSYEEKTLIIFSDGGEDYDVTALVKLAKSNNVIPYIVATGSKNGAILSKNNKNLKDENNNLIVSRVNPILEKFANLSGGRYYQLDSTNANIVNKIASDLVSSQKNRQNINSTVMSHAELFYFPLVISIILFLMAVTKIHQLYVFLPLLFVPNIVHSSLIDFHYVNSAHNLFEQHKYLKSAKEFAKVTPSVESYYNEAVAYYKYGDYKSAVRIFNEIQTTNPKIKQQIYYNMGNCAVKIGKYARAKIYYQKALNLGFDNDVFYNLISLYKLKLAEEKDVSNMMPNKNSTKETQASKKKNVKADKSKGSKKFSSDSSQKAAQSSMGASSSKDKQKQQALKKTDKVINSKHQIGYKAYELINKGYTNEKSPW